MISFKRYLAERAPLEFTVGLRQVKVYVNPLPQQIETVIKKSQSFEARYLIIDGKLYLWDSRDAIHNQMFRTLVDHGEIPPGRPESAIRGWLSSSPAFKDDKIGRMMGRGGGKENRWWEKFKKMGFIDLWDEEKS